MHKVAYNDNWGGFGLPPFIREKLAAKKGVSKDQLEILDYGGYIPRNPDPNVVIVKRHDPDLIEILEMHMDKTGKIGDIAIKEIQGDKYIIDEYDGLETVMEPKDIKWISVEA